MEQFHYEQDVGKRASKLDGRGIFDNHDYSLKLDLSNPDIGCCVLATESIAWYDGSGGYFPGTPMVLDL